MNQLFVDGGVIGANPSGIGGTWAWRHVGPDSAIHSGSGCITPAAAGLVGVTNNLTEMMALLMGLRPLPNDWRGTIYSDSAITLGRAFDGWRWAGIPMWMQKQYQQETLRLVNWRTLGHVLLDGHPTAAQLAAGVGKRGHPVSEHNVWCDKACRRAGEHYLAQMEQVTIKALVAA